MEIGKLSKCAPLTLVVRTVVKCAHRTLVAKGSPSSSICCTHGPDEVGTGGLAAGVGRLVAEHRVYEQHWTVMESVGAGNK